ncbi:MAG TPA: hypothetical protein ENO08_03025, partial [Candidatus Eisenbacteria bacterium]|nr:hypothetical protein [Candidatus Eisenbacteria bacterium]
MMTNNECGRFQDRLDRLEGALPEGRESRELERHAAECPDCAIMLETCLHLAGPFKEELESKVPAEMADSMWAQVSSHIADRRPVGWRWSLSRVIVPALAAAVILLVFWLGMTLGELRYLRGVEERMAAEIERRENT